MLWMPSRQMSTALAWHEETACAAIYVQAAMLNGLDNTIDDRLEAACRADSLSRADDMQEVSPTLVACVVAVPWLCCSLLPLASQNNPGFG